MKSIFSKQEQQYIFDNYKQKTYRQIADDLGFTEVQVRGWVNNHLPKKNRQFDDHYFDEINLPDKAYWLGFIYADGWISSHEVSDGNGGKRLTYEFGVELDSNDEYILNELNNALGGVHTITRRHRIKNIAPYSRDSESFTSSLRIYSKNICAGLNRNGVEYHKTLKDTYPVVADHLFLDFLRGYIDGDGCLYIMRDYLIVNITSSNKIGLEYIQNILRDQYDVDTRVYSETERKHRLVCYRSEDVKRLLDMIYYSEDTPKLERKYAIYRTFYGLAA